jgi:hypothetical protein
MLILSLLLALTLCFVRRLGAPLVSTLSFFADWQAMPGGT